MKQSYLLLVFITLLVPFAAFSATTGKISGVVTDASTGDPLPGVNLIIVGSTMGAATDVNGRYFILNVPPGFYDLQASIIGYKKITTSRLRISIDRTTTVNFSMDTEVVEGQEVTIVAERPRIQKDVSFTQTSMSGDALIALPITPDVREAISTNAGIGRDANGFVSIRGGHYDEVSLLVDGFNKNDNRQGTPEFKIASSEIQEIQVLKGGFNAEFGKARSGVINIITKEGGQEYNFKIDTRLSPAARKHFGPDIYSPENWWYVGRFLSLEPTEDRNGDDAPDFIGWNAYVENAGGEISGTVPGLGTQTVYSGPQALEVWKHQHPQIEYAYKPDYNLEATFSGPVPFTNNRTTFLASGFYDKAYYFHPFVSDHHLDTRANLRLNHRFSSNTILRVHGGYSEFLGATMGITRGGDGFVQRNDFSDPRTNANAHVLSQQQIISGALDWFNYYVNSITKKTTLKTYSGNMGLTHVINPSSFFEAKFQYTYTKSGAEPGRVADLTTVVADIDGFQLNELPNGFYGPETPDFFGIMRIAEDNGRRDRSTYSDIAFDIDYTMQINYFNQIKTGFGIVFAHEDLNYGIDLLRDDPDLRYLRWIRNDHHYYEAEMYVQDKIEFKGMIMNAGLRFDYFKTDAPRFTDPWSKWYTQPLNYSNPLLEDLGYENPGGDTKGLYEAQSSDADGKVAISPRLGIAHPIGENSKFYFNYGYFYQRAEVYDLSHNFERRRSYATFISNSDLDFRKTVAYEAGIEQNIADIVDVTISGYYRDISQEVAYVTYNGRAEGNVIEYARPENVGYSDVRGFELTADFHFTPYVIGFFNYDYALESGGRYGFTTIYQDPNRTSTEVAANINEAKARPNFKVNLRLMYPISGSSILDKIFSGASLSTFFSWRSGVYLTYHGNEEYYPGLESSNVHWKATYNLDIELVKPFFFGNGMGIDFYLQIQNVLNSQFLNPDGTTAFRSDRINTIDRSDYLDIIAEQGMDPGDFEGNAEVENVLQRGRYWLMYNQPRDIWLGLRVNL
jgi:hypothetical protein